MSLLKDPREKEKLRLVWEAVKAKQEAQQEENLFPHEEKKERLAQSSRGS